MQGEATENKGKTPTTSTLPSSITQPIAPVAHGPTQFHPIELQ